MLFLVAETPTMEAARKVNVGSSGGGANHGGAEKAKVGFGGGDADPVEHINVEFVSANPTGPLTAASGRHGAFGDALVRLLRFRGHEVGSEYYFNDAGTQIDKLGESIRARARGEDVPEGGYEGDYVVEVAAGSGDRREARYVAFRVVR